MTNEFPILAGVRKIEEPDRCINEKCGRLLTESSSFTMPVSKMLACSTCYKSYLQLEYQRVSGTREVKSEVTSPEESAVRNTTTEQVIVKKEVNEFFRNQNLDMVMDSQTPANERNAITPQPDLSDMPILDRYTYNDDIYQDSFLDSQALTVQEEAYFGLGFTKTQKWICTQEYCFNESRKMYIHGTTGKPVCSFCFRYNQRNGTERNVPSRCNNPICQSIFSQKPHRHPITNDWICHDCDFHFKKYGVDRTETRLECDLSYLARKAAQISITETSNVVTMRCDTCLVTTNPKHYNTATKGRMCTECYEKRESKTKIPKKCETKKAFWCFNCKTSYRAKSYFHRKTGRKICVKCYTVLKLKQ